MGGGKPMLDKKIVQVVEHYLKLYPFIDREIEELEKDIEFNTSNTRDINSNIKGKNKVSKAVENQIVAKIQIEDKIKKYRKWQAIIDEAVKYYRTTDSNKYTYLKLKYFKKFSISRIEIETTFSNSVQYRIRQDIVDYLALFAIKEDLLTI